jgi:16S rRNA processing protein RimM
MTKLDPSYHVVGRIGSTYGVRGWIKVHSYTEFGATILEYNPWYLANNDHYDPFKIEESRMHGQGVVVKFVGINTPEEARLLTGRIVAIPRAELPVLKENEYYWSDLIGLSVIDQNGLLLGKVIYLIETGSNDVLVVKGDKEHAIPYLLGEVVTSIDLTKREIHVDWEVI